MKQFEALTESAEKIGIADMLREAEERIGNLKNRKQTGVFIAGGANSGKTTILNGIVGTQLREPGLITEEEKPLKVVFEKQDDEEAFECRLVANRFWNNEDAILYEVKNTDIFQENREPARLLDAADTVFYVVSAVMPFSSEDMDAVKALSFLRVKVVLNKMDLLDENSQKKVAEYVSGICTTLGVGAPIMIRMPAWEDIAKEFRAALLTYEERELIRKEHEEMIRRATILGMLGKVEEQLSELRLRHEKDKEEQLEMSIEAQEKQALWGKLRTRMLESGAELSADVSHNIKSMTAELSEKLGKLDPGEREPDVYLQRQMEKVMERLAKQQSSYAEERMKEDSRKMMESAVNLGLVKGFDFNDVEFSNLTNIKIYGMQSVVNPASSSDSVGANDKRNRILAGTAAAVGLFFVLPLPTPVSWVGGIAAAGIGGSAYVCSAKEIRKREWQNMAAEYCKVNLCHLADSLSDSVKEYYKRLADAIKERANAVDVPVVDEDGFHASERELRKIEEQCKIMLQ